MLQVSLRKPHAFIIEFMAEDISIHDANRQEVNPQALGFNSKYISEPSSVGLSIAEGAVS